MKTFIVRTVEMILKRKLTWRNSISWMRRTSSTKLKEPEMPAKKKTVTFKYTDGRKVTRSASAGKAFNLRAPIALRFTGETEVVVDFGVICDHPVQLFEAFGVRSQGVRFAQTVKGFFTTLHVGSPIVIPFVNL